VIFDVTGYFVGETPIPTCNSTTPEPVYPSEFPVNLPSILADNFEAGPGPIGSQWTVDQEGDATVAISTEQSHTGLCAGKFTVSTSATSRAYISKLLGGSKTEVWASGWFDVTQAGVAGSNAAYLRFFDGSSRIADVYRQNDDGAAWLGIANGAGGRDYINLNVSMPLDSWHQVILHVAPNGTTSTVQVWIDGVSKYASTAYNLHTTTQLTTVQLGNEFVSQQMVEYFDDVTIGAS
jgi:hypothetical protein